MFEQAGRMPVNNAPLRLGGPPIPHEHGAWVMLLLPAIVGFSAAGGAPALVWLALLAAVTGLFLAREAAGLLLRKRGKEGTSIWLAIYLSVSGAAGVPLLLGSGGSALLMVGAIAAVLFAAHSVLLRIPARKRLDRSVWGEILGSVGLTLTGPAAWAVARGGLPPTAWALWGLSALYFAGGVFYVKMWLEAVKYRRCWSDELKLDLGIETLIFHCALAAVLLVVAASGAVGGAGLLLAAYTPAILRAFVGWRRLSPVLPNLKKVGLLESGLAIWFGVFLTLSLI